MDDTISRQAAIDAIRRLPNAGIRWFVSAEAVFDALLNLPTAQPEQKKGKWILDRSGGHMTMDMVLTGIACFIVGTWFGLFLAAIMNASRR